MDDQRSWAELDEDWARKERRALERRAANEQARLEGRPLPYPGLLAGLDPTKLGPDASPEDHIRRYREFCKICPPPQAKRHTI